MMQGDKMRVLFITRGSLVGSNNTGNTIINIFSGIPDIEIYNLFLREEKPNENLCKISCQISELSLIKYLTKRSEPVTITYGSQHKAYYDERNIKLERKAYDKLRNSNSKIPWFGRELLWALGAWKNKKFEKFLEEASPEIIFMPAYGCWYPYRVLNYIHKKRKSVPVFIYHVDDNYSFDQSSFLPSFWLYRIGLRKWIRSAERYAAKTYAISDSLKNSYDKYLNVDCTILTKGSVYDEDRKAGKPLGDIIQLCYTGNIGDGRMDVLIRLGRALDKAGNAQLHIYSGNEITKEHESIIKSVSSIVFHGKAAFEKIKNIQEAADILVHVESFSPKNVKLTKYSVSTKLFDYFNIPKCILAVGPAAIASIDLLKKGDAGYVIDDIESIDESVVSLLQNREMIKTYKEKAWKFGQEHFSIEIIQRKVFEDFVLALKGVSD